MQKGNYKWLIVSVFALVVINIAMLASLWWKKDGRMAHGERPPGDARDFLVTELHLTKEQQFSFDSLRKPHFELLDQQREEMRVLKDSFFSHLAQPADTLVGELAARIGNLQTAMDLNTFRHFAALRSICTPAQRIRLDVIIRDVLRNMARPPGGPPPR